MRISDWSSDVCSSDLRANALEMTSARARAIADRHLGIGCDQLILIGPSDEADVRMRIFNADGSEVDACGNATRCIPLFLGRDCRIETNAGLLNAELHGEGANVDMGQPRFGWDEIHLAYAMDTLTLPADRKSTHMNSRH